MILRGQPIDASAALAAGLIDEIVEMGDLRAAALERAREFADLPSKAYASIKQQVRADVIAKITAAVQEPVAPWFTEETRPAMTKMIG